MRAGQDHPGLDSQLRTGRSVWQRGGVSARTVNLDGVALRNVLKFARRTRAHRSIARSGQASSSKSRHRKRRCSPKNSLVGTHRSGEPGHHQEQPSFSGCYLRFLALTGAREKEALAVRWVDVDFDARGCHHRQRRAWPRITRAADRGFFAGIGCDLLRDPCKPEHAPRIVQLVVPVATAGSQGHSGSHVAGIALAGASEGRDCLRVGFPPPAAFLRQSVCNGGDSIL